MVELESVLSVVIRSSGERTRKLCQNQILNQIGSENVSEVSFKAPFYNSLISSYEVALAGNKKYSALLMLTYLLPMML